MPTQRLEFSFEYFPPKTDDGWVKLQNVHQVLSTLNPEFFSVTYGAGGSTQERTMKTVFGLQKLGANIAPHLSCIGATREELSQLLDSYAKAGINRIVALRGDMPSGMGGTSGDFAYAADLVRFIREQYQQQFMIEVAAYPEMHPQARDLDDDIRHFIDKANAGADSAITQYFYNADAFFRFRDRLSAAGCNIPLVPGIMPITNFSNLVRFSDVCGAEIPRWIRKQMEAYRDDTASARAFGIDVVADLCQRLVKEDVSKLHFYTMNQNQTCQEIIGRL